MDSVTRRRPDSRFGRRRAQVDLGPAEPERACSVRRHRPCDHHPRPCVRPMARRPARRWRVRGSTIRPRCRCRDEERFGPVVLETARDVRSVGVPREDTVAGPALLSLRPRRRMSRVVPATRSRRRRVGSPAMSAWNGPARGGAAPSSRTIRRPRMGETRTSFHGTRPGLTIDACPGRGEVRTSKPGLARHDQATNRDGQERECAERAMNSEVGCRGSPIERPGDRSPSPMRKTPTCRRSYAEASSTLIVHVYVSSPV